MVLFAISVLCAQGLNFPPEAGYPFDSHKERFYLMESHYSGIGGGDGIGGVGVGNSGSNIPEDLATAFAADAASPPPLDNSGLRLHVTAVLRPHDAGVLSIGMYTYVSVRAPNDLFLRNAKG